MLYIGLYEPDKERCRKMRERIVGYSVRADKQISLFYFTDQALNGDLEKYSRQLQIVLLSMDSPAYLELGKRIYKANPSCRICYYKEKKCDLEPVLQVRPIGFFQWEQSVQEMDNRLDCIIEDMLASSGIFYYDTRKMTMLLPVPDILYFQSDLKYVDIHLVDRPEQRIYGKLSDIETALDSTELSDRFVRIHKSYLVNLQNIQMLNKTEHSVLLSTGEWLPVSNAQYTKVLQALSKGTPG